MDYLTTLIGIITVNLLLSGDNALVIALASRRLPPRQRQRAVLWGGAGAVGLRIILTLAAVMLLRIPYLLLTGGLLLEWVAIKLAATDSDERTEVAAAGDLFAAIKTILLADLVMSLDNVLAIAGVARGSVPLIIVGLAISIPIIIWGSKAVSLLMDRWPIIILAGAAFLGWTAGDMLIADPATARYAAAYPSLQWAIPGLFGATVILFNFLKEAPRYREPGR